MTERHLVCVGRDEDGVVVGIATVVKDSDKAVLVRLEDGEVWVPKSQIHDDSEVWKSDQTGTLIVTRWFAEKQGWHE